MNDQTRLSLIGHYPSDSGPALPLPGYDITPVICPSLGVEQLAHIAQWDTWLSAEIAHWRAQQQPVVVPTVITP